MSDVKKSKILTAALSAFLRYGFRRVNMNDIAEAAGVSRPALYVLFKSKEDIFAGVYSQWIDQTVSKIELEMEGAATPEEKIKRAFEIWAVEPFEIMMTSPEAKELVECSFEFAQGSLRRGYNKFEATIMPVLASLPQRSPARLHMTPERAAHVLASAVRGLKLAATTADELRQLINELLMLSLTAD